MDYYSGRGTPFQPVGSALVHGIPEDRWQAEYLQNRRQYREQVPYVESNTYRFDANALEFPTLIDTNHTRKTLLPTPPQPDWVQRPQSEQLPRWTNRLIAPPKRQGPSPLMNARYPTPLPGLRQFRSSPREYSLESTNLGNQSHRITRQFGARRQRQETGGQVQGDRQRRTFVDCATRILQMDHHLRNWEAFPRSLSARLETFLADIRPPMSNDEVRQGLQKDGDDFRRQITASVRSHLVSQRKTLELKIRDLHEVHNVDEAMRQAVEQLKARVGRRFNPPIQTVNNIKLLLGSNRRQTLQAPVNVSPRIVTTPPVETNLVTDVPTANRFGPLSLDDEGHISDEIEPAPGVSSRVEVGRTEETTETREALNTSRESRDSDVILSLTPPQPPPQRSLRSNTNNIKIVQTGNDLIDINGLHTVITSKKNLNITLHGNTNVLIIGDSNLRSIDKRTIPHNVQVICIPGARLELITDILKAFPTSISLKCIIIAVGMCHLEDCTIPEIRPLFEAIDKGRIPLAFMGTSVPEIRLKKSEIDMLHDINAQAMTIFKERYIPPLRHPVTDNKVHYSYDTANNIFKLMMDFWLDDIRWAPV